MKDLSSVLPAKKITLIQTVVCFALILVICFMSFGTIFSLSYDFDADMLDMICEAFYEIFGDEANDVIETIRENEHVQIDVSLPFLMDSASSITDIVDAIANAAEGGATDPETAIGDIADKLASPDFVNFVIFIILLVMSFTSNALVGFCNLLLLIMVIAVPLTAIISAIRAVFGLLLNLKDIGNAFHKISRAFFSIISIFPLVFLVMIVVPKVQLGGATYGIIALCAVGILLNLVASRLKHYESEDFKYINILQLSMLGGLVGYVLYLFNIMKSEIINAVYSAVGADALDQAGDLISGAEKEFDFLPLILSFVLIILIFAAVDNLTKIITRFACMGKSHSDLNIRGAVTSLLTAILPFVMMALDIGFEIGEEQMPAFIISVVGLAIMAAAEIVLAVLPQQICPTVTAVRRQEIVTGAYIYVDPAEAAAAEAAAVPAAAAEEAAPVVEEAPAEEEVSAAE
ncbi:MAG: hypothetical protein IJ009_05035 [Clostridia bacterium]|nr:hypothetical protein [Clostridia bacterium]